MRGRSGGFSLIEILLVLLVIVLLTSMVALNVGSGAGERLQQQQALAIRDGAMYALDEARFTGRDFGLLLHVADAATPTSVLRWRERRPEGWRKPARGAGVLDDIELQGDVQLVLDGLLAAPLDPAAGNARAGTTPQWQFLASGDTQTGELQWRDERTGELLWRLQWDALGRFEVFRGDEVDALAAAR